MSEISEATERLRGSVDGKYTYTFPIFNPMHMLSAQMMEDLCTVRDAYLAMEWQPIATAPRDGSEVLLVVERRAGIPHKMLVGHYMPGGHCIEDHPAIDEGWYFFNGCMFDKASKPLMWMPLPESPVTA